MKPPRNILITGSAGGIGQALAKQYAGQGSCLLLHGRSETSLLAISRICEQDGAKTLVVAQDLVDHMAWMEKLAAIDEQHPIDLAFVNAGVAPMSSDAVETWSAIQETLDVNLRAAMATTTVLARSMQVRQAGHIVLISSLAGRVGMAMTPAYCATKAALTTYGDAMRGRLAPFGVRVSVVLPGFVESAMSNRYPAARLDVVSASWAAARIRQALARNPAHISFPAPLAFGLSALAALPVDWSNWILARLGYAVASPARVDGGD